MLTKQPHCEDGSVPMTHQYNTEEVCVCVCVLKCKDDCACVFGAAVRLV